MPHPDPASSPAERIDRLLQPFRVFAAHKLAGSGLLLLATVVALAWANSPWGEVYERLLGTVVSVGAGELALSKPLALWINDGLMGVFFFVVGLEVKREVLVGELSRPRRALLPLAGALGGMIVPAAVYLALNAGRAGAHGWGVPMATDIAFALGVLALLGDRVPVSLKVFLTALAIADDIGAILVIALFYTDGVSLAALGAGGLLLLLSVAASAAGVRSSVFYFVLGTLVWLAFLKSGVHATLAAVLMAFTIPARNRLESAALVRRARDLLAAFEAAGTGRGHGLLSAQEVHALHALSDTVGDASAPLQNLEHALNPLVTLVVLPVFALANAGVALEGGLGAALAHPVGLGVLLGLFAGKQVGIVGGAWLAVRLGLADLPPGVGWRRLHGVAVLGGIGFTMALFVGGLAFADPALRDAAKVGTLAATVLSAGVGLALLRGRGAAGGTGMPA